MNLDRVVIEDPPEFHTRYQHDDTPEALGDEFELTVEEKVKLTHAAQRGPTAIKMALAGDDVAPREMRRLKIVRWEVRR